MFYEAQAVDVPCPGRTAEELLRAHAAWVAAPKAGPLDTVKAEVRSALARLHAMQRLAASDVRIAEAMRDTCRRLRVPSDTLRVCESHGLPLDEYALKDESSMDVSRFPVYVTFDPEPTKDVRDAKWPVHAMPGPNGSDVQFSAVSPHQQVRLACDVLRGHMAVFVFRAPNTMLTRVADGTILGLAQESGAIFVSNSYPNLEHVARTTTLRYGATWVWVHAKADHFMSGPRTLRSNGCSTIVLERGNTLVLQRREDFGWHFRTIV